MNRASRRAADKAARRRAGRRVAAGLGAAGLVASGAVALAAPASAAAFTVTTTADAGAGSLRQAVLDANASPGADTITFAASVTGEIVLATAEIEITEGVTISGPGSGVLTISGDDVSQIFEISSAAGETTAITGLTLTEGDTGGSGGAVTSYASTNIVLDDVVISDSFADDDGGGLYLGFDSADGVTVTITNSRFEGNRVDDRNGGGAAIWGATVTISNVVFQGNATEDYGGGLYISDSTTTISDSTFTGNSSQQDGGGLYITDPTGPTIITSSLVSGNTAGEWSTDDTGGGFYFRGEKGEKSYKAAVLEAPVESAGPSTLRIENSVFRGNATSDQGGAGSIADAHATIVNSLFEGNEAGSGGALSIWNGAQVEVFGSTFTGNTAIAGGAISLLSGFYEQTALALHSSTISGNDAVSGSAISSARNPTTGGEDADELSQQHTPAPATPQAPADPSAEGTFYVVDIVNSTISGNVDVEGSTVDVYYTALTVDHTTIAGNSSPAAALSLFDDSSTSTITNTILWNPDVDVEIYATEPSISNSLIGVLGMTVPVGTGNLIGVDPILGPLADNGGPTLTLLPANGSPAINAGNAAIGVAPALDQRGLPRVSGAATDMGAVEGQVPLVITDPLDATRYDGESVTFEASASGEFAIAIHWEISADGGATWQLVSGAVEAQVPLTFTALLEQDGLLVRAVFVNGYGTATTKPATLTVLGLAKTGAEVTQALPLGAALVALGAAMMAFARRRRV